jgi:hercynylcysteine S-oxide lyase
MVWTISWPLPMPLTFIFNCLGSFGAYPIAIRNKLRELQDQVEAQPDPFIRYQYPDLLNESRKAVSKILNVPVSTVVFVPNATTGVNTVLRNLVWNSDGKDEIIYFNTIYGACGKTVEYVCEASHDVVKARKIDLHLPIDDSALLFKNAIGTSRALGCRPRVAIFDTISSLPGVRMPFEELTAICHREGILSLIDAAHGIGHIALDLSSFDPDFLVSNCHKWLFTPRSCAVFYVPERNQALMRSTLPTSHGFTPRPGRMVIENPLPRIDMNAFVANFEFVGTGDNSPYLCIPEAIKWRKEICGGEAAIRKYCKRLALEGGKKIAAILGTHILDNDAQTLTDCCMVNVLLPIGIGLEPNEHPYLVNPGYRANVTKWISETMVKEFKTFVAIFFFQGQWWARVSGQVYLDISDFEWTGEMLKKLCERVGKGKCLLAEPNEVIDTSLVKGDVDVDV